jgi:hypothetical protein
MWTATLVQQLTGSWPVYMRPPRGLYNDRVLRLINSVGMIPILWNIDPQDWRINQGWYTYSSSIAELEKEYKTVLSSGEGPLSLHHDYWPYINQMLPYMYPTIKNNGYDTVLVHDCIKGPAPYSATIAAPVKTTEDGEQRSANRCAKDWATANSKCGPSCTSSLKCTDPSLTCFLSLDLKPCPILTKSTSTTLKSASQSTSSFLKTSKLSSTNTVVTYTAKISSAYATTTISSASKRSSSKRSTTTKKLK